MSVFANTREISGKATPNKTIAAFPDVCLSPPSPPAGPIPIPYPLTGVASDTIDGTSSVYIRGKEAGKKNGVKYSKVDGNQPATNSFGANIISHKITGPLKFAAYSFDVMIEKGGAERFMDLTTQNHVNANGGSAGVDAAKAAVADVASQRNPCGNLERANNNVRDNMRRRGRTGAAKKATITHGVFTPRGESPKHVRACSNARASKYYNGMAQGIKMQPPSKNADTGAPRRRSSQACGGHVYEEARSNQRPHTSHTEARIIEDLFKPGATPSPVGGSLVLSVNWTTAPGSENNTSQDACDHCKRLLCAIDRASNPSGCMNIFVCHGTKPEPTPISQLSYCQ